MKRVDEKRNLTRLQQLATMIRDREMAGLRAAQLAREASEARLADLAKPMPTQDLDPIAAALTEIRWQRWADRRRAEINLQLARQIVECDRMRDGACHAFARSDVLRRLRDDANPRT